MIAARCEAILKSGEPYPHLNDTNMMRTVYAVFVGLSYLFLAVAALRGARRRVYKKSVKKADCISIHPKTVCLEWGRV